MSKNIVVCADGTGNSFARRVSNVSRFVRQLTVDRPDDQLVFYDQGIGSHPDLVRSVRDYAEATGKVRVALKILMEPCRPSWMPLWLATVAGLVGGFGLYDNVKQMYQVLSRHWSSGDQVFLIGFSRGAFTVRALAGLVYRLGLVRTEHLCDREYAKVFAEAWALYTPHDRDRNAVARFKERNGLAESDELQIRFLGLWDTVKSYGGVWPKSLPHLRHNPAVCIVRHALALQEQRSWFIPTSWGGIDSDNWGQLRIEPDDRYELQDVQEVWFRGCHSDVGGGDDEEEIATIPLHWMLREAEAAGLLVRERAQESCAAAASGPASETHESLRGGWLLSEYVPRWELDNSRRPPKRYFRLGRSGQRHVEQFSRGGKVLIHQSAQQDYRLARIEIVS